LTKDKQELLRRTDMFEIQNEQLKLENVQLKKDGNDATKTNSQLQLQGDGSKNRNRKTLHFRVV
jgi:hypothetical protein